MEAKTTVEKLQVLLPHWVEHNANHEAEFRKWAEAARTESQPRLAGLLDEAAASMSATDALLKQALAEAGGTKGAAPHSHHHPHHH